MGLRYTNSGELVETGDEPGFFKKAWSGAKNLLGMAVEHKYPNIYEQYMNRYNANNLKGEMVYNNAGELVPADGGANQGDIGSGDWMSRDTGYAANQANSGYQPTTGYDADFFNQNTNNTQDYIDRDTGYDTEVFPSTKFDSQEDIDSKATTQVEDYNKRFEIEDTKTTEEAPVVDDEEEEPINDMLGYAMKNMFGGWGGPKAHAYQIPMMNSSKRGLKY
jgi:hypothetical protein|tara:strand:+ start:1282 stop:1941 length:660 start_codon:yes stop_codon:yes gene_type:complete